MSNEVTVYQVCRNCGGEIHRTGPDHPWYHRATSQELCGPGPFDTYWEQVKSGQLTPDKVATP